MKRISSTILSKKAAHYRSMLVSGRSPSHHLNSYSRYTSLLTRHIGNGNPRFSWNPYRAFQGNLNNDILKTRLLLRNTGADSGDNSNLSGYSYSGLARPLEYVRYSTNENLGNRQIKDIYIQRLQKRMPGFLDIAGNEYRSLLTNNYRPTPENRLFTKYSFGNEQIKDIYIQRFIERQPGSLDAGNNSYRESLVNSNGLAPGVRSLNNEDNIKRNMSPVPEYRFLINNKQGNHYRQVGLANRYGRDLLLNNYGSVNALVRVNDSERISENNPLVANGKINQTRSSRGNPEQKMSRYLPEKWRVITDEQKGAIMPKGVIAGQAKTPTIIKEYNTHTTNNYRNEYHTHINKNEKPSPGKRVDHLSRVWSPD